MNMLPTTCIIYLDVDSMMLQKKLALPEWIEDLELEVTYTFYDSEQPAGNCPRDNASIELEKVTLLSMYTYKDVLVTVGGTKVTPTDRQAEILYPFLDVDTIETLVWESREEIERDMEDYDYD